MLHLTFKVQFILWLQPVDLLTGRHSRLLSLSSTPVVKTVSSGRAGVPLPAPYTRWCPLIMLLLTMIMTAETYIVVCVLGTLVST